MKRIDCNDFVSMKRSALERQETDGHGQDRRTRRSGCLCRRAHRSEALRTRSVADRPAQQLGISFQQVQKYETGQNRISASRLHHTATALGTSVETFFPPVETARGAADDGWEALRFITATADGRTVAAGFPLIEDRDIRRAVARIVRALARDD